MFFLLLLLGGLAHAEVGFHRLDALAPEAVVKSRGFVYELVAPGGDPVSIDIAGETEEGLSEIADARSQGRWRPDLRAPMILSQLRLCREKSLSLCPFLEGIKVSTAFLLASPHYIVASEHGVDDLLSLREKIGADDSSLPLALLNEKGDVVRTELTLRKSFDPAESHGLDLSFYGAEGMEGGIPFASFEKSAETYAMGYPASTYTRERYGKSDAVTDSLTYTKGHALGGLSLRSLFSSSRSFLRTDHDGNGGLSGGPLLNERGEVVAVVAEGVFEHPDEAPEALLSSDLEVALGALDL